LSIPPSSAASAFSITRRLPDPARNLSGQARGQAITVAELIGDDHVLFGPQRQHRLVPAIAVVRALAARLSQRITVASTSRVAAFTGRRHCRSRTSSALALAKPNSGTVSAATGAFPSRSSGMELRQKVARRLRPHGSSPWAEGPRQVVAEQQRQRLVLAKLIEILGVFIRRLHGRQAFDHLRDAQTPLAALQPDLPVDHRRGLVWGNASINPRTPAWPMISPVSSSTPISKSSRSATLVPPAPHGKATIHQNKGRINNLHANSAESTPGIEAASRPLDRLKPSC